MKNNGIGEKEEEHLENLNKKIGELTLKGLFWGKNGAVVLEKERIKLNKLFSRYNPSLLSATSSTYYAASGNALSHIGQTNLFSKTFWFWRAWRCLCKAKEYSDKFASLKKMEDMSLGELDTRACILNQTGRRSEAIGLLSHRVMKILTGQTGTKHELCLLLIHEAEIIAGTREYVKTNAEENYKQAMRLLEDETIPVLTKVRVMKSYGKFLFDVSRSYEAKHLLNKAYWLAEGNKLFDQAVKIKALLGNIK